MPGGRGLAELHPGLRSAGAETELRLYVLSLAFWALVNSTVFTWVVREAVPFCNRMTKRRSLPASASDPNFVPRF